MKKLLFILLVPILAHGQDPIFDVTGMAKPGTPVPTITTSVSVISTPFAATSGTAGGSQNFSTSGTLLVAGGLVTPPAGYEVSTDNSTFTATVSLPITSGAFTGGAVVIYLRLKASDAPGNYNGNVSVASTGAVTAVVAISGTVISASPSLSLSGTFTAFNTTAGIASAPQTVTATGSNLTANATVTPPAPIVVSLDGTTYNTSATITQSGGNLSGQPVTVWAKVPSTATAQTLSGNVAFASTGATTQNLAITGTVSASGGSNDTIDVNMWDSVRNIGAFSSAAPQFWNNWGLDPSHVIISNFFKFHTGTTSTVRGQFDAVNDNQDQGSGYNSGTTSGYPVAVFRNAIFNTTTSNTLTFTGLLTPAHGYRIEILTSRNTTFSRPETFSSGAASASGDAKVNDTTFVLDNLTAASGTITISLGGSSGFWFVNGFRIIAKN